MESQKLQVTICGGGNTAHFSAAVIGSNPNLIVNVFTRRPQLWEKQIIGLTKGSSWEHKGEIVGNLNKVSSDPQEVSKNTKIFIVCGPAHIHIPILQKIAPFVEENSFVGTIFGQGGFDMMANYVFGKKIKTHNITLFGLQNVPSICKINTYGKKITVIGPKQFLYAASNPLNQSAVVCKYMESLFSIKTLPLPNFLSITLTPSNQIIHPGRIYGVFKNWDGKTAFKENDIPLIYEDMDAFSADCMQYLDDEIQLIKYGILKYNPRIDLSTIIPMKDRVIQQYGDQIKDKRTLETVFKTNIGYSTLKIPVKKVQGGVIPDIEGRIFWEDVPYGLCILKNIADMVYVKTPWINKMIEWHQQFMSKQYLRDGELIPEIIGETGAPRRYGIKNIEELLNVGGITPNL